MREGGGQATMALITNEAGSPGTLSAGIVQTALVTGSQEIPTAMPKYVAAGGYSIMAIFGAEPRAGGRRERAPR